MAVCDECGALLADGHETCPDCGTAFCSVRCAENHRELGTCPHDADGAPLTDFEYAPKEQSE